MSRWILKPESAKLGRRRSAAGAPETSRKRVGSGWACARGIASTRGSPARAIARESDAGALGRIRQLLLGPSGGRKCVAAEIER